MKKLRNSKNKKLLIVLVVILALAGVAHFVPIQSKYKADWCAKGGPYFNEPPYKERYSILGGDKKQFDDFNTSATLAIGCPEKKTSKLYI